jgi:hypothetical protein
MSEEQKEQFGRLAEEYCGVRLPLQVLKSEAGYYLGTRDDTGPFSRESQEYWKTPREANEALLGRRTWTQKLQP